MSDVNDLINALKSGDMSTSNVTFASLMQDKMNAEIFMKRFIYFLYPKYLL